MNEVRSPSRSVVLGAVVWVAVVAAVAALVWVVITRAGTGVANDDRLGGTGAPAPIGTSSSREPTGSPDTRAPTPSDPTTRPDPEPEPVQRSASGAGGTVTVSCTGAAARLVGATPNGGYGTEVEDAGPGRVRVDFESEELETRIEAGCANGSPSFTVDEDD